MRRIFFHLAIFAACGASAADLTPAQQLTLRSAAVNDGAASVYVSTGNDQSLAAWLNAHQPTFYAWRSSLTPDMSRSAIVQGATQLDALTVGKRDSLLWLLSEPLNPADAAARTAIDDLCGSQNILKGALQAAIKRTTTRAEKLLSTGTGTSASPATLEFEGELTAADASGVRVAQ